MHVCGRATDDWTFLDMCRYLKGYRHTYRHVKCREATAMVYESTVVRFCQSCGFDTTANVLTHIDDETDTTAVEERKCLVCSELSEHVVDRNVSTDGMDIQVRYITENGTPHYDVRTVCTCGAYLFTKDNFYLLRENANGSAAVLEKWNGTRFVVEGCGMATVAEHDARVANDYAAHIECRKES